MPNLAAEETAAVTELLSVILDAVGEPVFVKDREHRFVLVNDACCKLLGVEPDALIGKTELELAPPCELDLDRASDEGVFETGEDHRAERPLTDARGRRRIVAIRKTLYRNTAGTPFLVGVLRDVTERRQAVKLLLHQSLYDRLTGLGNRFYFDQHLRRAADEARRNGRGLAVLCLDLDRFNVVNQTLGNAAGDLLLEAVAQRLQSILRVRDRLSRLSGDDFACLVKSCDGPQAAERVAQRIHDALIQPFEVGGTPAHVTVSIGIAWSPGSESSADLLRFADVALHRAKRQGGSCTQVFDAGVDAAATERLHLQNELQQALRRGELVLHYQPVLDMKTGEVSGAEALVRWAHPSRGLVPPDEFIPLAEETGLIVPLGDWVLQEACRQAMRWKQRRAVGSEFSVSVNVSAKQLRLPGLAARVEEILTATGLPARNLILELTENVLLEETARARELCEIGARLAIDDFGTGYASLAYLRELPVSMLKIARPFISKLGRDVVDTSLVNTILTLVRDLGLVSVAEGVEDGKQADLLRQLRCDFGQGFLFARPLPAAEFEELLSREAPEHGLGALSPVPSPKSERLLQTARPERSVRSLDAGQTPYTAFAAM